MSEQKLTAEEKLAKYEKMLEELLEGVVKEEGIVMGGPDNNYYKIKSGGKEIVAKSPMFTLVKGDHVIVSKGSVVEKMPVSLISLEEEEVQFSRIGWNAIGGMKSQIDGIRKKVEYPSKYSKIYKEFNMPLSKGILLYGPTGCGKTLIARAIASSMLSTSTISKNIFVYLKGGELLSKWVGETENRIKNAFESTRKTFKKTGIRPIIFIDEAEAILPQRGSRLSSDVDTTIVPTFLSEMDGFEDGNPFILLATNYEERIDAAILRPGRIDLKVYVGRPTLEDSVDIFKIHLAKTKLKNSAQELAEKGAELVFSIERLRDVVSGAMIENIVYSAIELAISRRISGDPVVGITLEDLTKSITSK